MSRPIEYDPELHAMTAYLFCSSTGAKDRELSKKLDISTSTLHLWKKKYPEFSSHIIEGKKAWQNHLRSVGENSLMKRVKGGRYTEKTYERVMIPTETDKDDPNNPGNKLVTGVEHMLVTKKVSKSLAPDPQSIKFLLANLPPEEGEIHWRNLSSSQISGPDGNAIPVSGINIIAVDPPKRVNDNDKPKLPAPDKTVEAKLPQP